MSLFFFFLYPHIYLATHLGQEGEQETRLFAPAEPPQHHSQ